MSGLALFWIETAKSVCRGQRRLKVKTPVRSSKSEGAHFLSNNSCLFTINKEPNLKWLNLTLFAFYNFNANYSINSNEY